MQLRAVARMGTLLVAIEPASQANLKQNRPESGHPSVMSRQQAAADAGLTEHKAKHAPRMANYQWVLFRPNESFDLRFQYRHNDSFLEKLRMSQTGQFEPFTLCLG